MNPAKRFYLRSIYILLTLFIFGCSSTHNSNKEKIVLNFEHLYENGVKYWDQRISPDKAGLAVNFLKKASEINPNDYNLQVLLSRAYHFHAEYISTDPVVKDSLFTLGMNAAYQGLTSVLGITHDHNGGSKPQNITELLPQVSDSLTSALYWWTANFGRLMVKKPVLERIKNQEVFERVLYKLTSLNPNFYYGGPYRILGAFYARIPGADLDLAKTNFEISINNFPKYFATKVLMAEFYYVKIGNREKFHSILKEVINDDPTLLPAAMAENLFEQKRAQMLLDMEASLFE